MTRATALAFAFAFAFGATTAIGCGKHVHGRQELDEATTRYYLDLRWGRIPAAAARVHPDMRAAFVEDWARNISSFELQDLEVVDVREDLENDRADVIISVSYVDRSTMQLKAKVVTQAWARTEHGWLAMSELDLR